MPSRSDWVRDDARGDNLLALVVVDGASEDIKTVKFARHHLIQQLTHLRNHRFAARQARALGLP